MAALPIGKAIAFDAEGRPSFTALRSREGERHGVLVVYDLLEMDGEDIRREPLQDRRKRLARLLRPPRAKAAQAIASGIVLSEAIEGKGEAMFREACRMGLEGIVSKRLGSSYVSTRTRNWLKVKNPIFERS